MKTWYVLYTKPRWEKKIAGKLTELGLESYCPLNRVERRWSDRKKIVSVPLFSCYVFVRPEPEQMTEPLKINGVHNYISRTNKPAPVRDSEIQDIRRFLSEYDNVHLEKIEVKTNDKVEILFGPLMDMVGKVTHVNQNHVKVAIQSLGYSLVASVSRKEIRKVNAGNEIENKITGAFSES